MMMMIIQMQLAGEVVGRANGTGTDNGEGCSQSGQ